MKTRSSKKQVSPSEDQTSDQRKKSNNENQDPNFGLVQSKKKKKTQTRSVIKKNKITPKRRDITSKVGNDVKKSDENKKPSDNDSQAVQQHENIPDSIEESEPTENEARAINQMREELHLFREDVLVYAWTNSSRMDLLEEIVGKVVVVTEKVVNMVDGMAMRLNAIEQVRLSR